jgi:hypothetical protein
LATQQLQTLSGVAKGLTRTSDSAGFETFPAADEVERMQRARDDIRMVQLRERMLHAIQGAVELWSTDAGISEVRLVTLGGLGFPYCVSDGFYAK